MANVEYKGLGRRKSSIARVKLTPGVGKITINNRSPEQYFPNKLVIQDMLQPLTLTKTKDTFDASVVVYGGGFKGQAGAVRLGLTRALIEANFELKKDLRLAGLVTRDARVKERKKFGLYGARRAPQFTKR
ncbi:30S ribosomal protein S9 [Ureaplasma canigenitalium]|uniref:30S ribosomal protein S9 n=1 Tax=Ureaplasma canigenitalium TaxID=42092 RepID=UPI0004E23D1C|nr:30S ribosomal protein S9 [Ureaplasma canigenitalium]